MMISPVIACVKFVIRDQDRLVGVAFVNTTDRLLGVCEFRDNDLLSNFEALLIQLDIKECVLPEKHGDDYEYQKFKRVIERANVACSSVKFDEYGDSAIAELQQLVKESHLTSLVALSEKNVACSAMSWLIDYLGLITDESASGQFDLVSHSHSQFMHLDSAAVKALHIMPTLKDGSNKNMSLYGLLDKCSTSQGSRLLHEYLHQPLLNIHDIKQRQDIVEVLFESPGTIQDLHGLHLKNMPDLSKTAKRLSRGKGGLKEVVKFYEAAMKLPGLGDCLANLNSNLIISKFLDHLIPAISDLKKFTELVESTIDLDAINYHEYRIKAQVNDSLGGLKEKMDSVLKEISIVSKEVAEDLHLELDKKLKVDKSTQYGYFLKVSRADSNVLRNKKGYTELSTQKSGIFFTTNELRKLSNEMVDLNQDYQKIQSNLVKDVLNIVATYCPVMEFLNSLLAELDVLCSLAHVASCSSIPYTKPMIHEKGTGNLILKESRHPCVEIQDGVSFISNDIKMIRGQSEFILITGPNMGGKSTYIRQIAAICLLAQIGSFVPCHLAEVPIFDRILARVGAGDSQLKGISTFMAEMQETANILKTANESSLVIIDELGRGTSTYDGFGLAWAISEHLSTQTHSFTLFATHFHELTALSETIHTVKNLHVSSMISIDGITLLYKVQEGSSDQSFGIHVAELAKFPQEVIKLAKHKVAELEGQGLQLQYDAEKVHSTISRLSAITDEKDLEQFLISI